MADQGSGGTGGGDPAGGPGSSPAAGRPDQGQHAAVQPLPPFDHTGSPLPPRDGDQPPAGFFGDLFQTRYREVTFTALAFAIVIGIVMNAAITYAGLKIGFTLTGSAIAAVIGFGVLRGVLRRGTILETNIAQTVASSINTSNSGVIFTVPVLFLLGYQLTFGSLDFWLVTLACIGGGLMGCAFIVPLRKQMLDIERLRFPSAVGVSMILKSPGAGAAKAIVLLAGMALGALIFWPVGAPSLPPSLVSVDRLAGAAASGLITEADAESTRQIAAIVDARAVPAELTAAVAASSALMDAETGLREVGTSAAAALYEAKVAKEKAEEARQAAEAEGEVAGAGAAAGADADAEPASLIVSSNPERAAAKNTYVEAEKAQAEAIEAAKADHPWITDPALRLMVEEKWDDLKSHKMGWASVRLPGYANLDLRLPDPPKNEDGTPAPLGDLDRDGDGKPDPWLMADRIDVGRLLGLPGQFTLVFAIAPFALGAGYITGRAGLFVLAGGILAFFVINPIGWSAGWVPSSLEAHEASGFMFNAVNKPLGIGLLLGGALMGVLASLPAIREAVRSIGAAGASAMKGGSDELSMKPLIVLVLIGMTFLFSATLLIGGRPVNVSAPYNAAEITAAVGQQAPDVELIKAQQRESAGVVQHLGYAVALTDAEAVDAWEALDRDQKRAVLETFGLDPGWLASFPAPLRALLVALVGGVWIWFAGIIIAQCTGMTDWSPISGMALLTVVLVLLLAGTGAVVGAVLIGATLCVAITLAADMMADLKTGYLVGARPKRQQTVEIAFVALGPIVCMLTLALIAAANMETHGVPLGPGTETTAPQAQALQSVITGVQGGEMPYALYGFGSLLGILLGLGAFSGLGVLIGLSMYLPFIYIATYGIGCVTNMVVSRIKGKSWAEEWGVPFAAGLVVGESLLQLGINIVVLAAG